MSTPIAADDEFQVNAATSFDRDDEKSPPWPVSGLVAAHAKSALLLMASRP